MSGVLSISGIFASSTGSRPPILSSSSDSSPIPCVLPVSPPPPPCRPPAADKPPKSDWRTLAQAAALRLAVALAGAGGAGLPGGGQARPTSACRWCSSTWSTRLTLKPGDPRAVAGRAGRRCWSPTGCCASRSRSSPSCANSCSTGRGADRPARLAGGVRAPAAAEPALPPRAPDRRRVARHRARLALDPVAAQLHDLQHPADAGRDRDGDRAALGEVRRLVRRPSPSARWCSTSASRSR